MTRTSPWMAVLAVACIAAVAVPSRGQAQADPARFTTEYRVGPRDELEIKIIGEPETWSAKARVSEKGTVSYSYLGEIYVEGMTVPQIEIRIAALLVEKGQFKEPPRVSVVITGFRSKQVSVLGAVQTPGAYDALGRRTLLQVITDAGGLTKDAGREIIVIRRLADGNSTVLKVPTDDLFVKGDPKFDIPLEPNDVVNVQVDREVVVYVTGQVKTPGALRVPMSRIPTLVQALTQAGWFTDRAAQGRVKVKRYTGGKEVEMTFDVKAILRNKAKDVSLEENDVVFVPQTIL